MSYAGACWWMLAAPRGVPCCHAVMLRRAVCGCAAVLQVPGGPPPRSATPRSRVGAAGASASACAGAGVAGAGLAQGHTHTLQAAAAAAATRPWLQVSCQFVAMASGGWQLLRNSCTLPAPCDARATISAMLYIIQNYQHWTLRYSAAQCSCSLVVVLATP